MHHKNKTATNKYRANISIEHTFKTIYGKRTNNLLKAHKVREIFKEIHEQFVEL